jgi:hypothetical protein
MSVTMTEENRSDRDFSSPHYVRGEEKPRSVWHQFRFRSLRCSITTTPISSAVSAHDS